MEAAVSFHSLTTLQRAMAGWRGVIEAGRDRSGTFSKGVRGGTVAKAKAKDGALDKYKIALRYRHRHLLSRAMGGWLLFLQAAREERQYNDTAVTQFYSYHTQLKYFIGWRGLVA
jgi:hypothetical protein